MNLKENLYVGIDFGTTYSGVSWMLEGCVLRVINQWPNSRGIKAFKVPTLISYNEQDEVEAWGNKARDSKHPLAWFKLLLQDWTDPSLHENYQTSTQVADFRQHCPKKKTALDVASDYLRCLWNYALEDIKRDRGKDFLQSYSLRVVLGVPAIWSIEAKNRMRDIASSAGIPCSPDQFKLVSEPEAATLAVARHYDRSPFPEQSLVVICDAGGGTVDLISYFVHETDPLELSEYVQGAGDMCGSINLNTAFERHIAYLVGSDYEKIPPTYKQKMLDYFDRTVKPDFSMDDTKEVYIELSGVTQRKEWIRPNIASSYIPISHMDMRHIFESVGFPIKRLVCEQVEAVLKKLDEDSKTGLPIAIVLVGGFGESTFLYELLKKAPFAQKNEVNFYQPQDLCWRAVVEGAARWALDQYPQPTKAGNLDLRHKKSTTRAPEQSVKPLSSFTSRISRYSLGVRMTSDSGSEYSASCDFSIKSGFVGKEEKNKNVLWFIREGTPVENNYVWKNTFNRQATTALFKRGGFDDEIVYRASQQAEVKTWKTLSWHLLSHRDALKFRNWFVKKNAFSYTLNIAVHQDGSLTCWADTHGAGSQGANLKLEVAAPTRLY